MAFKMKSAAHGGPMRKNFPSAFKETDAEFEARMAKEGMTISPTVEVPQYSHGESELGRAMYSNIRSNQSPTWSSLSSDEQKKFIEKGQTASKKKAAYIEKNKTHKIVKGEWVPR